MSGMQILQLQLLDLAIRADTWFLENFLDLFVQSGATIFGILAINLISKKNKWGFVAGLASQPFWYATTIMHHQWILIVVNIAYTVSWHQGYRLWFTKEKKVTPNENILAYQRLIAEDTEWAHANDGKFVAFSHGKLLGEADNQEMLLANLQDLQHSQKISIYRVGDKKETLEFTWIS